jgi:isopentenyl-diphosphate delta-isomerase
MKKNDELVVLVDKNDNQVGVELKSRVHHKQTPLHRGFSVFLFDEKGRVLVQQRAKKKKTWGGVWANSCCGHPGPGESYEQAVRRRVKKELGVEVKDLRKVSDYRYRFEREGVVENEICPIFRGKIGDKIKADKTEVEAVEWLEWEEFLRSVKAKERDWAEWCREEVKLIRDRI